MEITPAAGTEAYLLDTGEGFVIRVYNNNNKREFIDYDIRHMDLKIKLLDGYFYNKNGRYYIDYSPKMRGLE